ncbi:hypothetical protein EBZ80_12545 [bacterium]|nr:hypothetical protein [bacterium]
MRQLAQALRSQDIQKIRGLLQSGLVDDRGRTPLYRSVSDGDAHAVDLLLRAGADPNLDQTLLHTAVLGTADTELVPLLLRYGADPRLVNDAGDTALHVAAERGRAGAVRALLNAHSDPNAVAADGMTALHRAARDGHADVIAALSAAPGINLDRRDRFSQTPLHVAAERGHDRAVAALLESGARSSLRLYGDPPLHLAVRSRSPDTVLALLRGGADPRATDRRGRTALHLAAVNGEAGIVSLLLGHGGDPNAEDERGNTAFHYATAIPGNEAVVAAFLASPDTDLYAQNTDERTPFGTAVDQNATRLLQAGYIPRQGEYPADRRPRTAHRIRETLRQIQRAHQRFDLLLQTRPKCQHCQAPAVFGTAEARVCAEHRLPGMVNIQELSTQQKDQRLLTMPVKRRRGTDPIVQARKFIPGTFEDAAEKRQFQAWLRREDHEPIQDRPLLARRLDQFRRWKRRNTR